VAGVSCRQVHVTIPIIYYHHGYDGDEEEEDEVVVDTKKTDMEIMILEATADAQETLVNLALEDDDDDDVERENDKIVNPNDDSTNNKDDTTTSTFTKAVRLAHGDPYGAVLWPAATAVAQTIVNNPTKWLQNKVVCEWGTGTGLVSLAAALLATTTDVTGRVGSAPPRRVIATDYEVVPLQLLQYAYEYCNNKNKERSSSSTSSSSNKVPLLETQLFDLLEYDTTPLIPADVYLAADVMYEPRTGKALAHRVVQALQAGARVLIGDSPGRAGRPAFEAELQSLGIRNTPKFVTVPGWTVTGDRHDLICSPTSPTVTTTGTPPQPLSVALMELDPDRHCPSSRR
jgi:predicted nicotinamide N-methyase